MGGCGELLARAEQEAALRLKSISVDKEQELQFDLGNLLALDPNPASGRRLQLEGEAMLRALARDNTQLLIGQLWAVPTRRVGEVIVAELPPATTRLPREKPKPKARPSTRWEEFARLKGIRKKKRASLAWDERRREWRRRWGYRKANDQAEDWALEVPDNADPNEDQFAKRAGQKKERVAKNELHRLRNIARGRTLREAGAAAGGPVQHPGKRELSRAILTAKLSTASVGRFQDKLPKERDNPRGSGKRRQFRPLLGDFSAEKQKQLELLQSMAKSGQKPRLNLTKAVNKQLREDERQEAAEKRKKKKGKGGRGRGRDGWGGGKPKAGGKPNAGRKPAVTQRGKGK
uniref:Ribosome biogenesis regulatory protein n=1 Tax=Callorhinchus milii TaxID=7868 RepID=A0A4W3GCK4_CALMI